MTGTLYGIGVGPGDPELLTLKAWRLISTCHVIAYLAANGGESTARAIAKPFIPEEVIELAIDVPMRADPEHAQNAYAAGCDRIALHLAAGRDVAALCEGDPFFYGSFIAIFGRLSQFYPTVVVPGVSSVTACAAVTATPLAARNDVFKVVPATLDSDRLKRELQDAEVAAVIKVGRHFAKVRQVLNDIDRLTGSVAVIRATSDDQQILSVESITTDSIPYFSTILVQRRGAVP